MSLFNEIKSKRIKEKNIVLLLICSLVICILFCALVYEKNNSLETISLSQYSKCNNINYKIINTKSSDSDIIINAYIDKSNPKISLINTYIALKDIEDKKTFKINTSYKFMYKSHSKQIVDLKNVSLIGRTLKKSLKKNHKYKVYIILEDNSFKAYLNTNEVIKC